MKFAFIEEHLSAFPIAIVCQTLKVSRSGFYDWQVRPPSDRAVRREELAVKIASIHKNNREVYGSPRIFQALKSEGECVGENTVAKIMKEQKIRAKSKKKFVPRTTDSRHTRPVAENILDRQFHAKAPNEKWATDITCIATDEGWLYMAGVIDLCTRKLVGWSMDDHMRSDLVEDALKMAVDRCHPGKGLLHHSDRGVQYASEDYQHLLQLQDMICSMSGKGDCWDNAVIESFWSTLKTELVYHAHYATRAEARQAIFEYVEVFYNRIRLHSSLGYMSPEAFEASLK